MHRIAEEQAKLNKNYANASTFAKIAMLPDVERKWRLKTILTTFHASTPVNLLPYTSQVTQSWHYINLPYPANSSCNTVKPYNVVWAIELLQKSLTTTTDTNTQAVLMMLDEHYVGDVNQPLHVITNVQASCQGDEGGNVFCLTNNTNGKCSKSLHSLWDNGVGYIKPRMNIAETAYRLGTLHPKSQFTNQLKITDPMRWAKTNYGYASFIYNLPERQKPSPTYYHEGQVIATSQMALAGYRLANIMNEDLKN